MPAPSPLPPRSKIVAALSYNPDTGVFHWRYRADQSKRWNTLYAGKVAGSRRANGRRRIMLNGVSYHANRLAWGYVHGDIPNGLNIDHADGDFGNDAIANLRLCTQSQNLANMRLPKTSTSGLKGASYCRKHRAWRAYIQKNGKTQSLGTFPSAEAAHTAYVRAAKAQFGEFARAA